MKLRCTTGPRRLCRSSRVGIKQLRGAIMGTMGQGKKELLRQFEVVLLLLSALFFVAASPAMGQQSSPAQGAASAPPAEQGAQVQAPPSAPASSGGSYLETVHIV